jgi:cytochrome P450
VNPVPLLAQIGRKGALPSWACPVIVRISGFGQMLTTASTVSAVLDIPEVTVPYGERSSVLGLGTFPLALDGEAHRDARNLIKEVLQSSADAHREGLDAAEDVAKQIVGKAAGGRLDVAGDLVEPALMAWVERWFGLEGLGLTLLRSGRMIMHATFLNPTRPAASVDPIGLRRAVEWVRQTRPQVAEAVRSSDQGTLARELLERTDVKTYDDVAGHLLPLSVGPFGLGSWALDLAIDDLLDRSWELDGLETDEDGEAAFEAALRRHGPLLGVKRENPRVRDLKGTNGRIRVPKGPILAATACADRGGATDPFAFSSGIHSCLGRSQMTEVSGRILRVLGAASPRRIQGPGGRLTLDPKPSGFRTWPFPGRLEVRLLR